MGQMPIPNPLSGRLLTFGGCACETCQELYFKKYNTQIPKDFNDKKTELIDQINLLAKKQFESWGEPKSPNYAMKMLPGSPRYIEAQGNLEAALKSPDITGGATHFWSPAGQNALGRKPPKWSYTSPGMDIGATRFHKLSRADGGSVVNDALALVSGLI